MPVSTPAEIVTLSPISAVAFSARFTCAIEAVSPTRPTEAPMTVELTPLTVMTDPSGNVMSLFAPLFNVAFTDSEEILSMTLLSPMRAVTDPA